MVTRILSTNPLKESKERRNRAHKLLLCIAKIGTHILALYQFNGQSTIVTTIVTLVTLRRQFLHLCVFSGHNVSPPNHKAIKLNILFLGYTVYFT